MNATKTANRTATGVIEHYPVEFDGDLPIAGSVKIGYRVIRPENWSAHNPHHDSDIEWWLAEVKELFVPGPSERGAQKRLYIDIPQIGAGWFVEMINAALHDAAVSRACAKHYDREVL